MLTGRSDVDRTFQRRYVATAAAMMVCAGCGNGLIDSPGSRKANGGEGTSVATTGTGEGGTGQGGATGAGTGGQTGGEGGGSAGSGGTLPDAGTLFRHPGVLVNGDQLEFVKAKVKADADPWSLAFDHAKRSQYGSLSYQAKPRATVECGSYSNHDNGCTEEMDDAIAAYTHALLW